MKSKKVSTYLASTLVLMVALSFYAYSRIALWGGDYNRYPLQIQFFNSDTIEPGGNVILSGIPVGIIRSIHLNKKTFMSEVKVEINNNIKIPKDSQFVIGSVSMTDNGVIIIKPGHEKTYLTANENITNSMPYLSLEQQISNYIFGSINATGQ